MSALASHPASSDRAGQAPGVSGTGGLPGLEEIVDRRFRFAFDRAVIGMAIVSLEGAYLQVNEKLGGFVGRTQQELQATTWQAITHPNDVGLGVDLLREAIDKGTDSFQIEKRYLHADGSVVWVLNTVSLVRNDGDPDPTYLFIQVVDLTEQKRSQAAAQHLAAIVESTDEAILSIGLDRAITAWNPAAERMFGYQAHEALGEPVTLILPLAHRASLERILDDAGRSTGSPYHETFLQPRKGPAVEVAAAVSPIMDGRGSAVGISIVARDINEPRWLATTLDVTLAALEAALAEAKQSEERSRRFLADAAHQLRTPISGIRACAETLLRAPGPDKAVVLLADLVREASRASRLMGSLIRMSRLDQGEPMMPVSCDLVEVCSTEVGRANARARHLTVALSTSGLARPSYVLGVAAPEELLANLLDNATRHAATTITVVAADVPSGVELRVSDDGPGVEESIRDRIFERFGTFDGRGGSGLGLAIARELAHAHGGDLVYEPDGNVFVATLPVSGPG